MNYYGIRKEHLGQLRDSSRAPKMNARRWEAANRIHAACFVAADGIGPDGWRQMSTGQLVSRLTRDTKRLAGLGIIEVWLLKLVISLIVQIVIKWVQSQVTTFGWTPNSISGVFGQCVHDAESCL